MKNTIRVIALFNAKPEKVEELKTLLSGFVEPTRKEKGCIRYELHQNTSNSLDFAFIEEWESHETLDAHLQSAHIQAALPHIGQYLTQDPDIRRYIELM